ncbi:MAG TPA: TIGR03435 family protein [Bryobacteraceae bacterium]|nr:TIGR03435 family protein [Bryobacteraceae bacterium]
MTLKGTISKRRQSFPLRLRILLILTALLASLGLAQQAPTLAFESATVKLHPMTPGTFLLRNYVHGPPFIVPTSNKFSERAYVIDLIMQAYGVSEYQLRYLPAWCQARTGYIYDLETKAPGDTVPTPEQFERMMQSMLAEQFNLKVHWETKEKASVYALVPDKKGPKFKEFHPSGKPQMTAENTPYVGTTMYALAHFLSPNMDFPVIDGTGFGDKAFDFDVDDLADFRELDREQATDPASAQDYLRSNVLGILGLKMDMRKITMQLLDIDHIDQPPMK